MKLRIVLLSLALVAAAAVARAEDKPAAEPADGKALAEKKCKMCHNIAGSDEKKKPIKLEGKNLEWFGKVLEGTENTEAGKPHAYKAKLTDDEKKAVFEFLTKK
jgi:mono/diheme cytochrome c family protein